MPRRHAPRPRFSLAEPKAASGAPSPVKLGIATYTFRNFTRAQMIPWLKQLQVTSLNCKDVKDHLADGSRGRSAGGF